tara:strand:+ start:727 stop:1395 length:669 start_codon:yes stop_codon:yes gene_type:complete
MSWKDILKVDEFFFLPEQRYEKGAYNPDTDKVQVNLSGFNLGDEDKIIEELVSTITHEYSHKAVHPQILPLYEKLEDEMSRGLIHYFFDFVEKKEELKTLTVPALKIAKLIAYEEAFTYSTAMRHQKRPNVNVIGSAMNYTLTLIDKLIDSLLDAISKEFKEMKSNIIEEFKEMKSNIMGNIEGTIMKPLNDIEMEVRRFISKGNKLTRKEHMNYFMEMVGK